MLDLMKLKASIRTRDERRNTCTNPVSAVRAMACKAPRHRWHLRQRQQCGVCNLQNLQNPVGFESHPLRQIHAATPSSFTATSSQFRFECALRAP
jgi:hypothetical protein